MRRAKYSDDQKARITVTLPVDVDEQLRRLAAKQGTAANPIVRGWIIEKLSAFAPERQAE